MKECLDLDSEPSSYSRNEERRLLRAYNEFTSLRKLVGEIFLEVWNRGALPLTPEMRHNPRRCGSNEYCKYHSDPRHDTKDYWQLKNAIEDAIRHGRLKEYIADLDNYTGRLAQCR